MPQNKFLQNKKILMVIAPNNFRDEEYAEPRRILEESGAEIIVGSLNLGESIGAVGTRVKIDVVIRNINPQNFAAVIFVGGPGMVNLINNVEFTDLARKFYEKKKIIAAICVAPAILANAGILLGKKATVWSGAIEVLKKGGAVCTNKAVEIDGKIITANGPKSAELFGKAVLQSLKD